MLASLNVVVIKGKTISSFTICGSTIALSPKFNTKQEARWSTANIIACTQWRKGTRNDQDAKAKGASQGLEGA